MGRVLSALALIALLGACEDEGPPDLPALGDFNAHVLAVVRTYPTDGTHGYHWPRDGGGWRGNARTLRYEGRVLFPGDAEGRCHCSGLTFEVFLQAFERWCKSVGRPYKILDLDTAGVRRLQRAWFGSPENRATLGTAIPDYGLGERITDWEEARAGDFLQLWRHSGSGHAAVFRDWVRDEEGRITAVKYWSTQKSTNGIGERIEHFGEDGSSVKRDEFWLCRIGR